MLLLQNLQIANKTLLSPVNLSIKAAQCVCLYGASGSGKSLLLRAIADLDEHHGNVYLDDIEQQTISGPQWRRQIAYLTAENYWWHETIGEHFADTSNAAFLASLHSLGLKKQLLDASINQCSTGEKQRFAILRIIQSKPSVLLLDEATANLDPETAKCVETFFINYMSQNQTSILWVSHDPEQRRRISDTHYKIQDHQLIRDNA